ncbi:MAG TPA: bifunctional DNA primase/polymerase [Gemmataceae bacterium]|nr:bifunctional DNA primase/polymerase [Gemmataceae bacterium]
MVSPRFTDCNPSTSGTPPLLAARHYCAVGLSIIPIRTDGSKAPAIEGWRQFAERRPTDRELRDWFDRPTPYGIGIPGGPASGNLLILDFERWSAFTRWGGALSADHRVQLRRCPVVGAPRGGAHVYARLEESVRGAVYARTAAGRVMIETRGSQHQVVAPGSPACCHPTGRPYRLLRPGWLDGDPFTPIPLDVFHGLTVAAADLTEYVRPTRVIGESPRSPGPPAGDRPGDHFNARVSWADILTRHGWRVFRTTATATYWTRPGKSAGVSASTGFCRGESGHDLLWVFSSNAAPFVAGLSYSRFGAYALLEHHGDFRAASRALGLAGHGRPLPRRSSQRTGVFP